MQATPLNAEAILALDLEGSKLIEASAGTGKTYTIADLYLRHILAGRQPAEILVVTYTNAATEELQGRIRARLYQALRWLQQPAPQQDLFLDLLSRQWQSLDESQQQQHLNQLQLALRSMDEACISTIHGFCQRSLVDHALHGNQYFECELIDNDDDLWHQALRDWWRRLVYPMPAECWQQLRQSLPDFEELKQAIFQIRNKPLAQLLPPTDFDVGALQQSLQQTVSDLFALAPLWRQHREEIIDVISNSRVLSRNKKLPYHADNLAQLIASADAFFANSEPRALFPDFEFLGSHYLHLNSTEKKRGQDPRLDDEFFRQVGLVANAWRNYQCGIRPGLIRAAYFSASLRVAELKREIPALAFQDLLASMMQALESEQGESIAQQLRQQYPVAMIDEFQDTDAMQYRIFSYIYNNAENTSFTMIGDPKQAIYSFRGGDIFTYMQARQLKHLNLYSLQTNWRSTPGLVTAINAIFGSRGDSFIYHQAIPFQKADSNPANIRHALVEPAGSVAALTLWQLPQKENQKNYNREQTRNLIYEAIALEISRLLSKNQGPSRIDDKALQSGDFAILVRGAREGQALSQVLRQQGIRSVTIGRDSVFESEEATGLYSLLISIAQLEDPGKARRSLSSSLLQFDYCQIAEIIDDEDRWQNWLDDLDQLQQAWRQQGFISMFQALLNRLMITDRLAQRGNSERRITNLLHLAELLHQQSIGMPGIAPLMSWFHQQFEQNTNEAAEIRLENDEALVKIVTIHKAKGLQYPVVFVPFLWTCKTVDMKQPVYFHDQQLSPCIDLGSSRLDQHHLYAEKERLAEDIRLLYVALTRARSKVYLAWGQAGDPGKAGYANKTALAFLLHSRQSAQSLEQQPVDGFPQDMDFAADLQRLVVESEGNIECRNLPRTASAKLTGKPEVDGFAELAEFSARQSRPWRISSFTGLTRGVHQHALHGSLEPTEDEILAFPAGSHIGLMIHSLLEHLDFQTDIASQCQRLLPLHLQASGISSNSHQRTLVHWLQQIVQTPLNQSGLKLNLLSPADRLNELSFDFALDHFDLEKINRLLQSFVSMPLQPITNSEFGGLITGVIDLVFQYQGRYYLADYKSNFLGSRIEDYSPQNLNIAMLERRYDLQSLLYSVALHRYLRLRIPDYHYETHFGGSYYLFVRAMRARHGEAYGIHFDRPARHQLETLDELLDFSAERSPRV